MRRFYIEACKVRDFDRLLMEFCADGCADAREGVLLDNSLCYIGKCALAIFEWAETTNSSGYMVHWAEKEEDNVLVESEWYDFTLEYDKRYNEEEM